MSTDTRQSTHTDIKQITPTSDVSLHFKVHLKDGSIAEDTRTVGQPMQFVLGEGVFSNKFEGELQGMSKGDNKKIMLLPEDGFGDAHPANIFEVPASKFKAMDLESPLEEGMILMFSQPNGQEIPGIIRAINDAEVTVDFQFVSATVQT